jgi:GNAT superfamily N-acetyltransferase
MKERQEKSIDNLTAVWEIVGNAFHVLESRDFLKRCQIGSAEWPNRMWFSTKVNKEILSRASQVIKNIPVLPTLSYWSDFQNKEGDLLFEAFGFKIKSQQIGMSLAHLQKINHHNRITLAKISTEKQAAEWEVIYPMSFGYKIPAAIINKTNHLINYYLVHYADSIIGTVFTYQSGNTLGIHGLGIVPEFRKQGFAEEVMANLINEAIDENISLITLQSSPMGKAIYLRMGFSEDFVMTNYILKQ